MAACPARRPTGSLPTTRKSSAGRYLDAGRDPWTAHRGRQQQRRAMLSQLCAERVAASRLDWVTAHRQERANHLFESERYQLTAASLSSQPLLARPPCCWSTSSLSPAKAAS